MSRGQHILLSQGGTSRKAAVAIERVRAGLNFSGFAKHISHSFTQATQTGVKPRQVSQCRALTSHKLANGLFCCVYGGEGNSACDPVYV